MKIVKARKSEKAQSFVEMAVSFSVLLVLFAGLIDIGSMFFSYMALRDAAQEGVNYAMYNPTDLTGIENRTRHASSAPLDLTNTAIVDVNIQEDANPCLGKSVSVAVTYHYELSAPFFGVMVGRQTIPITASANGTIIYPSCY